MRIDTDPGWMPAIQNVARAFVLLRRRDELGLTRDRTVVLALAVSLLLYVVAFSFIASWDGGDEGFAPHLIVLVGAGCLIAATAVGRRDLAASSLIALAASSRKRMFIGIGLAEIPALFAIVTTFVFAPSLWLIVLGTVFSLVGLWLVAPSRSRLDRDQDRLRSQGSPLSLVEALNAPPAAPTLDVPE